MGIIINLDEFKRNKRDKKIEEESLKQEIRRSIDNDVVKKRYGIQPKEPELSFEERAENIKKSIARVNALMDELRDANQKGDKR